MYLYIFTFITCRYLCGIHDPKDKQGKDSNLRWCFSASYAASFLIDGIKLADSKAITVQKEVGDSEIEWALGAAYKVSGRRIHTLLCDNMLLSGIGRPAQEDKS